MVNIHTSAKHAVVTWIDDGILGISAEISYFATLPLAQAEFEAQVSGYDEYNDAHNIGKEEDFRGQYEYFP